MTLHLPLSCDPMMPGRRHPLHPGPTVQLRQCTGSWYIKHSAVHSIILRIISNGIWLLVITLHSTCPLGITLKPLWPFWTFQTPGYLSTKGLSPMGLLLAQVGGVYKTWPQRVPPDQHLPEAWVCGLPMRLSSR